MYLVISWSVQISATTNSETCPLSA